MKKNKYNFPECPDDEVCWVKGKFRGRELSDISSSYLRWLAENCYIDRLATAADLVWRWREKYGEHIDED